MMRWMLLGAVMMIAAGLGVFYSQGVTPADIVTQVSGKAFAMLDKRSKRVAGELSASGEPSSSGEGRAESSPGNNGDGETGTGKSSANPVVTVARVKTAEFVERVLVTGSLVAREQILVAPEVEGLRVLSYDAEEGDYVKKGQLLARLESTTLRSSLEQNSASIARAIAGVAQSESLIEEARAVLKEADASLKRARPLTKSRHISKSTFDQREAAAKSALARLNSARSGRALALAEKAQLVAQGREIAWRLSRADVRSPVEGLVARRSVRIGELASGSKKPMFEIITKGEIELDAEIDARNLAKIKKDQVSRVHVAGLEPLSGRVRLVSAQVDEVTRLGHARILLGRIDGLKTGAFARANVDTARSTGLAVPATALLYKSQRAFVLRVEGNKVRLSPVEVGLRSDGLAEIVKGLVSGDLVVFKSGTFLRDGDLVRPVEAVLEVHAKARRN